MACLMVPAMQPPPEKPPLIARRPTDDKHECLSLSGRSEVRMAKRAEAVYLDDLGNVVPREQARRVRITLVDSDGKPVREIWGIISRPEDTPEWPRWDEEYGLLG